jgi:4a-hydroxytetrahydrobiopterin dehydratase
LFNLEATMPLLSNAEITSGLSSLPAWKPADKAIRAEYTFKDFKAAMAFVNNVAEQAEAAWHHPDIDIRWNRVVLTLSTHDQGGVTEKDLELARKFHEASGRY